MSLMLLVSCGKKETAEGLEAPASPKAAVVSDSHIEAEITQALMPTKNEREAALADHAEDIIAQYPNKNGAELLGVPEVQESLKVALTKLGKDKALQNKINSTVALAAQMKGLSGEPGATRLDLDATKYDDARKSRMLQAVLSEDPKHIVRFLTEEIGEATPELSLGGADRADNGVAIKEQTPPAKPAATSPPD